MSFKNRVYNVVIIIYYFLSYYDVNYNVKNFNQHKQAAIHLVPTLNTHIIKSKNTLEFLLKTNLLRKHSYFSKKNLVELSILIFYTLKKTITLAKVKSTQYFII